MSSFRPSNSLCGERAIVCLLVLFFDIFQVCDRSPTALAHLQVLCTLLDPRSTISMLSNSDLPRIVSRYIMQHGLYENIHRAITAIVCLFRMDLCGTYVLP